MIATPLSGAQGKVASRDSLRRQHSASQFAARVDGRDAAAVWSGASRSYSDGPEGPLLMKRGSGGSLAPPRVVQPTHRLCRVLSGPRRRDVSNRPARQRRQRGTGNKTDRAVRNISGSLAFSRPQIPPLLSQSNEQKPHPSLPLISLLSLPPQVINSATSSTCTSETAPSSDDTRR